jgi:hypothetical protein
MRLSLPLAYIVRPPAQDRDGLRQHLRVLAARSRLLEGSHHAGVQAGYVRRGIDPALRSEVDVHLRTGWGVDGLRGLLMQRYDSQSDTLSMIPTTRQLENRKAFLVRTAPSGWDLRDYYSFNAWASERLATRRDKFFEVSSSADPRVDGMIILDSFVVDGSGETRLPRSIWGLRPVECSTTQLRQCEIKRLTRVCGGRDI